MVLRRSNSKRCKFLNLLLLFKRVTSVGVKGWYVNCMRSVDAVVSRVGLTFICKAWAFIRGRGFLVGKCERSKV